MVAGFRPKASWLLDEPLLARMLSEGASLLLTSTTQLSRITTVVCGLLTSDSSNSSSGSNCPSQCLVTLDTALLRIGTKNEK